MRVTELKALTPTRINVARAVAIGADFLQIVLFPMFSAGFISPFDDALDVIVCLILTRLVGWHYSFLPSFVVKVMPVADLVPSWTVAVFLATRRKQNPQGSGTVQVYEEGPSRPQLKLPLN